MGHYGGDGEAVSNGKSYLIFKPTLPSGPPRKFFWFLLKLYLSVLGQDPFLEGPPLSQSEQLSFPDLAEQNDADVGAAKMLLAAVRDRSLSHLSDVILRMYEG